MLFLKKRGDKFMKNTVIRILFLVISVVLLSCGSTQTAAEKANVASFVKKSVETFHFTFNAEHVYPTGFKSMYLSPYYDIKVSPDTVQSHLPYFGKAYRAPIHSDDNGIKFVSTDFDYQISPGKKEGNWLVTIKINDLRSEVFLHFDIWENGNVYLQVRDVDRDPISFRGSIDLSPSE